MGPQEDQAGPWADQAGPQADQTDPRADRALPIGLLHLPMGLFLPICPRELMASIDRANYAVQNWVERKTYFKTQNHRWIM